MKKTLLVILLATTITACGKEMPKIGGGDEEGEFNSCVKLSAKGRFEDSVQCLEMFKARYPQTKLTEDAELRIGDAYFGKKDYLLAAESYSAFLKLHPRSSKSDYAYFKMGAAYFKEAPKAIDRDQEYLEKAIESLDIVVRHFPGSAYSGLSSETLAVAKRRIAKRNFYVGNFYMRTGEYIAAVPRFRTVAEKFPDSGIADKALYKAIEASIKLNDIDTAKQCFGDLVTNFPKSSYIKSAEAKLLRAAQKKAKV